MRGEELTWAGGEHRFLLTIEHLRALQTKCDAGPNWVMARLASGQWFVDDVIQPIRLGLEGGGLSKEAARQLVIKHVEDRPLMESVLLAHRVLTIALIGVEDDPVGEDDAGKAPAGEERTPSLSREENGGSPPSTARRPSRGSRRSKSTK